MKKGIKRNDSCLAVVGMAIVLCAIMFLDNMLFPLETDMENNTATVAANQVTLYETKEINVEAVEQKMPETAVEDPQNAENLYTDHDLELLACAIYSEGGADYVCDECRYRIGDVILNRCADERFPDTIEEVLTAKGQYGRFYWTGIVWPERASLPQEAHAVERACEVARNLLDDTKHSELYGNEYIWQAEHEQGSEQVKCCGIIFGK